jgi:hypothetical protein
MNHLKKLRGLYKQAVAENDESILLNYMLKDVSERKRLRKQEKESRKRNRKQKK